jgi:hypothetical protein
MSALQVQHLLICGGYLVVGGLCLRRLAIWLRKMDRS